MTHSITMTPTHVREVFHCGQDYKVTLHEITELAEPALRAIVDPRPGYTDSKWARAAAGELLTTGECSHGWSRYQLWSLLDDAPADPPASAHVDELVADAGYFETWADARSSMLQRMFGALVRLSRDILREYEGDLFHDAAWLRENVNGPMRFYFVARPSGTHITTDDGMVRSIVSVNRTVDPDRLPRVWRMELGHDGRGMWSLWATQLTVTTDGEVTL